MIMYLRGAYWCVYNERIKVWYDVRTSQYLEDRTSLVIPVTRGVFMVRELRGLQLFFSIYNFQNTAIAIIILTQMIIKMTIVL